MLLSGWGILIVSRCLIGLTSLIDLILLECDSRALGLVIFIVVLISFITLLVLVLVLVFILTLVVILFVLISFITLLVLHLLMGIGLKDGSLLCSSLLDCHDILSSKVGTNVGVGLKDIRVVVFIALIILIVIAILILIFFI